MKSFDEPDYTFYYSPQLGNSCNGFMLYDGTEYIHESDDYSDDEVLYWAYENERLTEEDLPLYEASEYDKIDINGYREDIRDFEREYDSWYSPVGRVYGAFEREGFTSYRDKENQIQFVDGPAPGNDLQCVFAKGTEALERLQTWIHQEYGQKVNFVEFTEEEVEIILEH